MNRLRPARVLELRRRLGLDRQQLEELFTHVDAVEKERDDARDLVRQIRGLIDEKRSPHMAALAREAVYRWGRERET
jgi:hypothetical protein